MDIMEAKRLWADVLKELRTVLPDHAHAWVDGTDVSGFEDNTLHIITINAFAPQVIKQTYYSKIIDVLRKVAGQDYDFTVSYDDDLRRKHAQNISKISKARPQLPKTEEEEQEEILKMNLAQMQSSANLNLKYKFENFVVGDNSEFTYALAQNVAKNPAKKYNPLFIYGAAGLGKTHIMQAIGHYIIFNKPKLKVKYIKTEEYVNELIKSIQKGTERNKKMEMFRNKYRNVDILLIDDIQFIEAKERTMDEIFHTFDYLLNKNKQVVITSDRLPSEIPGLPARLQSRFEMGIVTEITPPDFETRVAILKNLAEQDGLNIGFDVCEYIANNYVNNVRELEGAYNKVSAYASIYEKPLTLDLAKKVLKCESKEKEITINLVAQKTAQYYGVTLEDFKSSSRAQKISGARHIAVYLAREMTGKGFQDIAEFFNKKHPTMVYSYEKVKEEISTNKDTKISIDNIKNSIRG